MSEELKILPCPHCGGEARTRTSRKMNTNKDAKYYVECKVCYSSSNPWYDMGAGETKAEAITAWNQRTSPLVDELVGVLEKIKTITGTIPGKGTLQAADIWNIIRVATDKAKEIKK